MAKKNDKVNQLTDAIREDGQFKSYKNEGKGFDELPEGGEIVGVFIGVKDQTITDIRTHAKKVVRVYSIRSDDGNVQKIGSRALLDGLFDDIMDDHGGFDVENSRYIGPGIEWLKNRVVKIIRGDDKKTSNGRMGTYEFLVETDE